MSKPWFASRTAQHQVFPRKPDVHSPVGDGLVAVTPGDEHGITLVAYLIAHAPPAPPEFEREMVNGVISVGGGLRQFGKVFESPARREARWRKEYAREVIALMEAGAK